MKRSEAFNKIKEIIPNETYMQYSHVGLEELSKIPELKQYGDKINKVVEEWKASDDYPE